MLLQYAFADCTEGFYVRTRSDGKLFNITRLHAKTKACNVLIRELVLADDTAITSHSEEDLQHLVEKLSHACKEFGLTISLVQRAESPPVITIDNTELEAVDTFTNLASTVSNSSSLNAQISSRIAKAGISKAEANFRIQVTCKRAVRKERAASARDPTMHICAACNKDCLFRIGLHSHARSCPNPQR